MSDVESKALPSVLVSELVADDPDMIDIVEEFIEGLDGRVAELRQAHEALDWDRLETLAHQLKGAGGSYGYAAISSLGATMESRFKQHAASEFDEWMNTLEQLVTAAAAGLKQT